MRRVTSTHARIPLAVVAWLGLLSPPAAAQQALPAWGRISIYFTSGATTDLASGAEGESRQFQEVTTSISWRSADAVDGGAEYAFDGRGAAYPGTSRESRMSVYDGYVGYRTAGGRVGMRAGQMWINDLGGLGSMAGLLVEGRRKIAEKGGVLRVGAFGGLEPSPLDIEYVAGVRKAGGYVAFEAGSTRRHVLGYVNVRNSGLTERSVLTTTNYLSAGRKFSLYQAGEYDLVGVGGHGARRLSYFLTNGRIAASSRVEVQGSYHRGRSIDTRSLALDVLQGAPISSRRAEGLLFESVGGRVWVTVAPRVRVTGGYSRDRTNSFDDHSDRYQAGANAWNVAGSGVDFNLTRSSISGPARSYSAWDVSVGRSIGSRLYLTGDYSTNLSRVRLADDLGGFTIEHRPRTQRYSLSSLVNLTRHYSLLLTADRTGDGDLREHRELAGLTIRF
jgi:hypothetical protein